jgi:hypothetical protein
VAEERRGSGLAMGFTVFASVILVTMGCLHLLWGLVALFNDEYFVVGSNYTFKFDVTTWGWIHLIFGLAALLAGFALFKARVWARTVGVIVATLSIIATFMSLPYSSSWALVIIALDLGVIWALTVHGRDITY